VARLEVIDKPIRLFFTDNRPRTWVVKQFLSRRFVAGLAERHGREVVGPRQAQSVLTIGELLVRQTVERSLRRQGFVGPDGESAELRRALRALITKTKRHLISCCAVPASALMPTRPPNSVLSSCVKST
jgi:hypothetical protein